MNVVTVLRHGGRYDAEWVSRLHRQVRRFHPDAVFQCLTDRPLDVPGVRAVPLLHDWPGWWAKMELFAPDAVLVPSWFLDLDTLVLSPLPPIETAHALMMVTDFEQPANPNSSVMILNGEHRPYKAFQDWGPENVMQGLHGDQDAIAAAIPKRVARLQDRYMGLIHDFKGIDAQPRAGIVCFRGAAKPDALPRSHWAAKWWRDA